MTTNVKFYVSQEESKLKIEIEKSEEPNKLEEIFAKKILAIASRMAFADLQQIGVFDVGASIVIHADGDLIYEKEKKVINSFSSELGKTKFTGGTFKISPDGKKAIPVNEDFSKNTSKTGNEESLDGLNWKVGENDVEISIDLTDANEVIGGLASVSATTAMAVFILVKQTIHKVEDHFGLEHRSHFESDDDYDDYDEYEMSDDGYY